MIIDCIERAETYAYLSDAFAEAMKFLKEHQDGGLKEDRYEISERVYALVKRYDSRSIESCKYEAHKQYIDVQYIVSGDECMGWAPKGKMREDVYLEEKDQIRMSGEGELYPLHAGEFMILFPWDAHMPCVIHRKSVPVEKIILKIRVED